MIEAALIGVLAGVFAGLLGIGGGALFVPALTLFAGLGQLDAEATSLLAIVPVALVGTWRQRGYGNVRDRDALALGVLASMGAVGGVVIANAVPERALELGFAALTVYVAWQLVRGARTPSDAPTGDTAAR
ncbi:MAG: sulfite exporter TauE/SafE family protein [Solirubrobacteraceae bacterium]|nr:sulfite exporter TauE/SafE family protein [Solirubrobacteraceae bacterium]